jgi:hypothetical protein
VSPAATEVTWEPASEDDCYLCGRGPTATNPVMFGNMTDLRESWAGVSEMYTRLTSSMMCAPSAPNHTHCRTFLRSVMHQLQQVQSGVGPGGPLGSPLPGAHAAGGATAGSGGPGSGSGSTSGGTGSGSGTPTGAPSSGASILPGSAEDKLDAMARCYPIGQLTRFLDPHETKKSHRRCRGGLLSMFRTLEQVVVHEHELPILFQVVWGCGRGGMWARVYVCPGSWHDGSVTWYARRGDSPPAPLPSPPPSHPTHTRKMHAYTHAYA